MAAIQLFHAEEPSIPIHFYGELVPDPGFPIIQHGMLDPAGLNELYNSCVAGLVLSATNVSLVPYEMLASGCIPVVNDADHNRMVLANEFVEYAGQTPHELVMALRGLVGRSDDAKQAMIGSASASVATKSWASVGHQVVDCIENLVREASVDQVAGA
ncbi:hypothetical protein EFY87_12995 [Flexivirga caeni]|uniref:WsaF C-terminal domain-containing protein n=2 Tax=Flexivirga caeni TaxID=2294115 RepID=A0A3M9M6I8_9MICO|nr:hypothetical protein EFY87_12995 [Flexivirga caeni]